MQSHVDFAYPWYLTYGHLVIAAILLPIVAIAVNGGAVGQNRLRSPGYECVKHLGGARAAAHIVLRKRA